MNDRDLPRTRVGLIGCGNVGRSHVRAYKDDVDLVACCDVRAEAAEEFKREFGFRRAYTRMEDLLADPAIELVDVCTQVSLDPRSTENSRLAAVRLGAPAGKHFLIEKPLAWEIDSAREIVELCQEHRVRLGIGHRFRYTPTMARAKEILVSGRYGEPFHAGYWLSHLGWHPPKPYARREQMTIVEIGIHAFDLFRYLLEDEPASVYCVTGRGDLRGPEDGPGDTHFDAIVKFRRGCTTNILLSIDNYVGRRSWQLNWFGEVHLECPRGAVEVAGPAAESLLRHCGEDGRVEEVACEGEPTGFRGLMAEMRRAVAEGRDPTMSGLDHLNTLATTFAAYQSAATGVPVAPKLLAPARTLVPVGAAR
jgi:predicted dehydrogenase